MLLPSDIIINSGRTLNGRDVNFVIREKVHSVTGFQYYIIFIHNPFFVVPWYEEPDYVTWEHDSLGYLKFYVTPPKERVSEYTLEIQDFVMRPDNDTVSATKQDKIKLFKGLGRLMLCCVTHFLLDTKKEVTVESPVRWHLFNGGSNVSGDYAMSDENGDLFDHDDLDLRVSKIQLLEEIWRKFGFEKDDDVGFEKGNDVEFFDVRSTVRDIQLNCINEFALNQTAFGRDVTARRYATIASLTRLREELYARQAKRAKKRGKWEDEDDYGEEEEGELEGRRAFDIIHSDDLWRHILEFV